MTMGYVLLVGWSSSVRYDHARALAEVVPGTTIAGEGNAAIIRVPLHDCRPAPLLRLVSLVKDWNGTALSLDDTLLPHLSLWHLASTAECAAGAALGGAGGLHCWGLVEGHPRSVPCRFLDRILPYRADGTPIAAWAAALRAAARTRTVAACPLFSQGAMTDAVAAWADGQQDRAWQRWLEARTANRLLADIDLFHGD